MKLNTWKYSLRTIVPDQTWVAIFKGVLGPGDLARVSPVKNADLPDQISPGLIKGAEYTSSAAIVQHAKVIKSLGLQWIGFDFESAVGFGKPEDLANPIAAIRTASNAAHGAGLLFACALDKVLGA
jgi:hypothetical protein